MWDARLRGDELPRRMRDASFCEDQRLHLYDDHVAPISRLIDDLVAGSERGWMPHVAPIHEGTNAEVLWTPHLRTG